MPIPRRALRLRYYNLILPIPDHLVTTNLSPQDGARLWLPAIPYSIASRALVFGSRDGETAFFSGGRAGVFGELSTLDVVDRLWLPAVADAVVGCALGSGDGDDVVAIRGCGGIE
jgi:hypothetical protein